LEHYFCILCLGGMMGDSLSNLAAMQQILANNIQASKLTKGNQSGAANPITAPWIAMPDGGFPFNTIGTINTPVMSPGTWVDVIGVATIPSFVVPNGHDGVIKDIYNSYNGGGFIQGSGALIWRILRNGQAVRGYDNILSFLGATEVTGRTQIRFGSGDVTQFQVQNVSQGGGGTQITCYFGGWFYPKKVGA
jgi:hypothetical protein